MNAKRKVLTVVIASLFLTTCKKEVVLPNQNLEKLFGTWEWVSSSGGWAGRTLTPASEGYSQQIEFTEKGVYKVYINDKVENKMEFTITENSSSIYTSQTVYMIKYKATGLFKKNKSVFDMSQTFKFSGDTLWLADECYDCFGHIYIRK